MVASLAQKPQLKVSQEIPVLNAPEGYLAKLKLVLNGFTLSSHAKNKCDAVLAFVSNLAEAKKIVPRAISAVKPDGLLWVVYPKGGRKSRLM